MNDVVLSEPVAPPSAIRVRKLDRADVRALGDLRGTEVTEGLLATLGDRARLAFFGAALDDRDAFGAIAEDAAGPVGYVLVASNVPRIERRALKSSPALALAAIWSLIVHGGIRRAFSLASGLVHRGSRADDHEPTLRLLDIVVAARARGLGVGRALIEDGLAECARRGHGSIGLSVVSSNEAAVRLYHAAGFVTTSRGVRQDGVAYELMRASLPRTFMSLAPSAESRW